MALIPPVSPAIGPITETYRATPARSSAQAYAKSGQQGSPRQSPQDSVTIPAVVTLEAGALLFEEGAPGDCAYFVEEGRLEVFLSRADRDVRVNVVTEGQVLGEMAIIDHKPRSSSVRALTPARLRVIPPETLAGLINRADPGLQALMRTLLERLRKTTAQCADDSGDGSLTV